MVTEATAQHTRHSGPARPLKVLCILGTRPEAIKMAPVIHELRRAPDTFVVRVGITAQHREMLDQMLRTFDIVPDYDLDVMKEGQRLPELTGILLNRLDYLLQLERPDCVLVQGDTTTAMIGGIAAFYHRIPVGHIEAGLRSWNHQAPFPEEVNRRVLSIFAEWHFAPTPEAAANLRREQVPESRIYVTGNPVIDALHWVRAQAPPPLPVPAAVPGMRTIVVTAHRRENFGGPLAEICAALRYLAEGRPRDVRIIFVVHRNPNVREIVYTALADLENVILLPPADYIPFVHLLQGSYFVVTDSGGLQEEAPGLGKPVLVLRDVTERPEALLTGTARLIGTERHRVIAEITDLLDNREHYLRMARAVNPYGDGNAARRIAAVLRGESPAEFAPELSTEARGSRTRP